MFGTLSQARLAFSHLNPAEVRANASRAVRVGLIAGSADRYAVMEEALVPLNASGEDRRRGMSVIYRGGDPNASAQVELVLYDEGIRTPDGAYVLYTRNLPATLHAVLRDNPALELPLARQFPGLRTHIVDRIVQSISRENAIFAFATALPNVIPSLIELPWAFGEWATDTAFLTANQIRMAFMIAAACGQDTGFARQKMQILSIAGGAFGWRAIARELAGKVPLGGGLIAKGAIAYAGTYVVGKSLELLHHGQMKFHREAKRSMYRDALERGREFARGLAQPGS
jgi:uncharacterized protein (DUF697 family)